jgi:hypothetical protein
VNRLKGRSNKGIKSDPRNILIGRIQKLCKE